MFTSIRFRLLGSCFALIAGMSACVHFIASFVGVRRITPLRIFLAAYLALNRRAPRYPDRDLMLIWGERDGWVVAVETDPAEEPIVLGYLGRDVLPDDPAQRSADTAFSRRARAAPSRPPAPAPWRR